MHISKSSDIEVIIQNNDDAAVDPVYEPSAPGRKRNVKPVKVQTSQAWRTLEDRLNERSLRHKLKEFYDD